MKPNGTENYNCADSRVGMNEAARDNEIERWNRTRNILNQIVLEIEKWILDNIFLEIEIVKTILNYIVLEIEKLIVNHIVLEI